MSINTLHTFFRGIFPVTSFLHVPRKMPQPVWMMLGTAFIVDLAPANAAAIQEKTKTTPPLTIVTALHTFMPWKFFDFTFPEEYLRARYVTGTIFHVDDYCQPDMACQFPISLRAVHPSLDLCLLTINIRADAAAESKFLQAAQQRSMLAKFRLVDAPIGSRADIVGYRGRGKLGLVSDYSQEALKAVPAAEREEMQKLHRQAVGKQDPASAPCTLLDPTRVELDNPAHVFSGMSGGPIVLRDAALLPDGAERVAAGFLSRSEQGGNKGPVPNPMMITRASAIEDWIVSVFLGVPTAVAAEAPLASVPP